MDQTPRPKRGRWRLSLVEALLSIGIAALLISIILPSLNRMRESGGSHPCPRNLRQIGQAMYMYAREHDGKFPDSLDELIAHELTARGLVCPSSDDTPASGKGTGEIRAALRAGGDAHLSYVYVGAGLTSKMNSDVIVAYDRLGNHGGDGCNVLYADGHVDWMPMPTMRRVQAEVDAGRLPVQLRGGHPVSQPATAPTQRGM